MLIWSVDSQKNDKIIATRFRILKPQCIRFDFGPRCGSLYGSSRPDLLTELYGSYFWGEGGKGKKEREMWERRGERERRRGPNWDFWLRHWIFEMHFNISAINLTQFCCVGLHFRVVCPSLDWCKKHFYVFYKSLKTCYVFYCLMFLKLFFNVLSFFVCFIFGVFVLFNVVLFVLVKT